MKNPIERTIQTKETLYYVQLHLRTTCDRNRSEITEKINKLQTPKSGLKDITKRVS